MSDKAVNLLFGVILNILMSKLSVKNKNNDFSTFFKPISYFV